MKGCLVRNRACDECFIILVGDEHSSKPILPHVLESSPDPDFVKIGVRLIPFVFHVLLLIGIDSMLIDVVSGVTFKKYVSEMDESSHKDVILGGDFKQ